MGKRLFLFIIAGIMGLVCGPSMMTTADTVQVIGIDNTGVVETVPEPEPEVETTPAAPAAGYAPTVYAAPEVPQIANYTVTAYSGSIVVNPSYADIYRTGNLIYGHNTGGLLGSLANRYVGEVFTITEGGVAQNYRVTAMVTYEKTADGYLNGDPYLMGKIVYGSSLALMTCAGVNYGNGDASHRLVVYAEAM